MRLYAVYNTNVDGTREWIDSYWLNLKNAISRFKNIWNGYREPTKSDIAYYVRTIQTQD